MPVGQRRVRAWDAHISVGDQGPDAAPVVLLLHGEEGPLASKDLAASLASENRVVTPFIPGFGGTDRIAGADRPQHLAYLFLDLLDELGLDRVAVVGTSLGAWLGLELAAMEPRRFESLVAISPVGVKVNGREERAFEEVLVNDPGVVRGLLYADADNDPWRDDADPEVKLVKAQTRESFMHYAWEPYLHNPLLPSLLPRLTLPTLVVDGETDGLAPKGYADQLAGLLSAERHTVAGAGHYPDIEQPEATSAVVAKFLAESRAPDLGAQGKEAN